MTNNDIFQRISIPEPCHENWNKMTPDQKGAFCKVCNKSVHDFSQKTALEVEEILVKEGEGKVCGRFSIHQLEPPKNLEIPYNLLPRNISPFRAFALAVFLVFGTALFGIIDASGQEMMGKVCVRKAPPEPVKKTEQTEMIKGDVQRREIVKPAIEPTIKTMGVVSRKPVITKSDPPVISPGVKDSVSRPINAMPVEQPKTVLESIIICESYTVGQMVIQPNKKDTVEAHKVLESKKETTKDSIPVEESVLKVEELNMDTKEVTSAISCFPNPGNGNVTLRYSVSERTEVTAELRDLQGRLVKTLFHVPGHYQGIYNVALDLNDLPNGVYLVRVNMLNQTFSTRFVLNK
jgi:hypothetical protein